MEDPRIVRTREAVLGAATDLLVEGGPTAVTIDAVVARSGVAKSTIYRHWTSRDELLVSVFEHCAPDVEAPDPTLMCEDALRALLRQMVAYLNDPHWARMIPALLMLKSHEHGVADVEQRMEEHQNQATESVFRRGIDEGVLRPDLDMHEAVAHLVGPLLFAHLTGSVPVTEAFADRTVEVFLAAYGRV